MSWSSDVARSCQLLVTLFLGIITMADTGAQGPLPGTRRLTLEGDLAIEMVLGMGRFLEKETSASIQGRSPYWHADTSSALAYEHSVQPNRERLARIIGAVDPRLPQPELEYIENLSAPAKLGETDRFSVYAVRWPVFEGVFGEGLLLEPKERIVARVVAIPDADQAPEVIAGLVGGLPANLQYARRLAENGVQVIVPTLASRSDVFSGNPRLNRFTNQPHREWIYRQAYIMGRHVIGYEVQKVRSAVDWMTRQNQTVRMPLGIIGWGEGGLLAFYSAALDIRVDAVLVSGYFSKREQLGREPIYRNLFGLLKEFGDAEIANLVIPRTLIVEHAAAPHVEGPPAPRSGRSGAAPGCIVTADLKDVRAEVDRARQLAGPFAPAIYLRHGPGDTPIGPVAEDSLLLFLDALTAKSHRLEPIGRDPAKGKLRPSLPTDERQERLVRQMEQHTQRLGQRSSSMRDAAFWAKLPATNPAAWREALQPDREKLWNDVIGRFPAGQIPLNPRTRLLHDKPGWTAHEVMLDVLPDVFAWGYLLLPKGMKPGEKRPVIIAQHGLNSMPADVIDEDPTSKYYHQFKAFGVRLVERGFIVFAPRNPYRADDQFRHIQRQANPLGKSIFSIIIAQHDCMLDWLSAQPFVDATRIGFYGLSYGGKTAMRVPAVLNRYALSICSGDFNEWIWKNATTDGERSYMFTGEYEMPEFNLAMTYSYAEMAAMIAPRPFMVERGHDDTVAIDEWVAYEYAKVNRLYDRLKIPERTEIEYFNGPHTIHGVGTFQFLHRHLNWPEPGLPAH